MPNFNSDVIIEDHDLALVDVNGDDIARLDQDGNLVVRREVAGALLEILQFVGATAGVTVGAPAVPGSVRLMNDHGEAIVLRGGDATVVVGGQGEGGDVDVNDSSGRNVLRFQSASAALYVGAEGNEGDVIVRDGRGREVMHMDGNFAALYVGAEGNEGDVIVRDGAGREAIKADGNAAWLRVGISGNEGDIEVQDGSGRRVMHMNGSNAALYVGADGNEGDVIVRDGAGTERIHLDGNSGDIKLMGADLAEDFASAITVEPGSVLVAVGPDEVVPATTAVDRRVIGVASGAGDLHPALRLGTRPGEQRVPVALVGRVYCKADASYGAIAAGDLLTTSATEGHAMRVGDPFAAAGAILGKALAPLERGTGLVPMLLTLR